MIEVLEENEPGLSFPPRDLRRNLGDGFPWHHPERPHPELSDPAAWWTAIEALLAKAFLSAGVDAKRAAELSHLAHLRYSDPSGYVLFDDVRPVLTQLAEQSWRHIILSNHVPELEAIVAGLGLDGLFSHIITSALIGYEKPHPAAYDVALEAADGADVIWMVGDNPDADARGAEAIGVDAILVRTEDDSVERRAPDLYGAMEIILGSAP